MERRKNSMSDEVKLPKGKVTIKIREVKTGKVVQKVEAENLIVSNFRTQVLFALAGGSLGGNIADWQLSRAQLGTSGTAPAIGDTVITGAVDTALTPSSPASKSLQLDGTLGAAEGNGITFREVGLVFEGAGLGARRTFSAMTKTATFEWDVRWVLTWP